MEFKSIGKKLTIKLPKCGDERNIIENYSIEEMKLEEDVYIKIINTPTYKSMKIAEKLREKGERVVGDREALGKLLKCHSFLRYQGPFTNTMEGKMYEFNSPEDDTYDYTTFKHRKTQQCKVWEVVEKGNDKLKLHLSFNASPATEHHWL